MDDQRSHLRAYLFAAGQNLIARKVLKSTASAHEIALTLAKQFALDIGGDLKGVLTELGLMGAEAAVRMLTAKGGELIIDAFKNLLSGPKKRRG